jgi:copper chaperone CopZ
MTIAWARGETTKTSFKVSGNCDMCKKRIEKAAKVSGVKSADWNEETKIITVTFSPDKISVDQIQQNIAKVGYDTEKYKADEEGYNRLPQCCQYTRKKGAK